MIFNIYDFNGKATAVDTGDKATVCASTIRG